MKVKRRRPVAWEEDEYTLMWRVGASSVRVDFKGNAEIGMWGLIQVYNKNEKMYHEKELKWIWKRAFLWGANINKQKQSNQWKYFKY